MQVFPMHVVREQQTHTKSPLEKVSGRKFLLFVLNQNKKKGKKEMETDWKGQIIPRGRNQPESEASEAQLLQAAEQERGARSDHAVSTASVPT